MKHVHSRLFFDNNDHQLLRIVNDVLTRSTRPQTMSSLLAPYMHPHGIKEMAAPKGLRIAYAIVGLLGSLEAGKASDRLGALRSLMDEVLHSATTYLRKNTARVLIQIMKELIRHPDDELKQLQLAHDFRMAAAGKPRVVRAELDKYHLLEMPEEWNQLAFDDHVHDANTKGRKSPTHLVMDAWVKGIRYLTVVYYNYVEPAVVEELLEAAAILDMHIRIGIEVSARFRGKYVRITWEPHGFTDSQSFLEFLQEQPVMDFMKDGRQVSAYQQRYVFQALAAFNQRHRQTLNDEYGMNLPELDEAGFTRFVGTGQPSLLHLAKYIQSLMLPELKQAVERMRQEYPRARPERRQELTQLVDGLNAIDSEMLISAYLQPCRNPDLHDPTTPQNGPDVPAILHLEPGQLLPRLARFHSGSRFTLNLSNLSIPDTLEILYDCRGHVSHLEVYNLKDASRGKWSFPVNAPRVCPGDAVELISPERTFAQVSALQKALNEENVIALKRAIRTVVWAHEEDRLTLEKNLAVARAGEDANLVPQLEHALAVMNERKAKLLDILFDIESFHKFYKKRPLESRIGSGSTGQSRHQHGMGLVVIDTLPARAREKARQQPGQRRLIPVTARMTARSSTRLGASADRSCFASLLARCPGLDMNGQDSRVDWSLDRIEIHPGHPGNILTLGGVQTCHDNGLRIEASDTPRIKSRLGCRYLNTAFKNCLKILVGFVPAFLTFALTKDWWVLAYLGGFIWFGITGVRNIIQAVLGGGGLRRSPLLQWNSLVSWSRISESLLYTGFSVPLLDFLVKSLLMEKGLGITTATDPITLYAVMALANGIYISSHNIVRGLPRSAAVGNFFRSILSIPLAVLFNAGLAGAMHMAAIPGVEQALQKWAAVISKLASDCVAAVIEGLADRQNNVRMRLTDYHAKLILMFDAFARLDVLFPEEDVLDMLRSPKMFIETINYETRDLEQVFIVNGLDLMYFWMYQPRARKALSILLGSMTQEEWLIFYRSQFVLKRYREISQLFVDGLVGKNFSKALAFYLDHSDEYLQGLEQLGAAHPPRQRG
ncbi:MAG: hypothetical protein EOL86_00690 [Deltaproteobacteria bacterium]|nr:hypothetical protein [Deltaproteobacteria bacterium]